MSSMARGMIPRRSPVAGGEVTQTGVPLLPKLMPAAAPGCLSPVDLSFRGRHTLMGTLHGEGFAGPCLAIGDDGRIVALQERAGRFQTPFQGFRILESMQFQQQLM